MTDVILLHVILLLLIAERVPGLRRLPLRVFRANVVGDAAFLIFVWIAGAGVTLAWIVDAGAATRASVGSLAASLPLWLQVQVAIALFDLGNFVAHRLMHRYQVLWRFHQVHHSSPRLDWLATFRSHLVEQMFRRALGPLLLIALGMPATPVVIALTAFLAWSVVIHANLDLPLRALEPILITPRLHLRHHVPEPAARNFGTVFSVWDRAFGSLDTRAIDPRAPLGVPGGELPQTFRALMLAPFTHARRTRGALPEAARGIASTSSTRTGIGAAP